MACIYSITNRLDGKRYVGQTVQRPERRFTLHRNQARRGHGHYLHRAMRAHGEEHFVLEVLEQCDVSMLDEREKFWIAELDTFGNGYNLNEGGNSNRRRRHSAETRTLMKERHWSRTSKRQKCIEIIRDANLERVPSEETRQRISEGCRGKIRSKEQRARYSASKLGAKNPMFGKPGPTQKTVAQFTLDGELIATFPSGQVAAASLGKSNGTAIRNCCKGRSASSYGFVWKYMKM